jgi:putative endonuclease
MTYWVYVIKNDETSKIYIGQSSNFNKRLLRHNGVLNSKNTSYTRRNLSNGQWHLVYHEEYPNRSGAIIREKQLKSYKGRLFIKKVTQISW